MDQITWNDFAKIEFRVGEIIEAISVEGSEKLIRMVVDFGEELDKRIVFSGIKHWYSPEELQGKKTVFVVNMPPKKIMGEESQAMIFGASAFVKTTADKEDEEMSILILEKDLPNGTKVF
jgi:methionyl-tRNA synthetase